MSISTFGGLNTALRGLLAQQRALDVTSHNIANANTEGYTRQEAVLNAEEPLANIGIWGMIIPGQLGQGVTVDSYRRIRDVFTDTHVHRPAIEKMPQPVDHALDQFVDGARDFLRGEHAGTQTGDIKEVVNHTM